MMEDKDIVSDGSDFDFANAKSVKETGKKESTKSKIVRLEKQIATSGSLTPAIIKEARELAATPRGLDIEGFMQKHKLTSIDVEQVLNAPLKKDGFFA
jgi:hypothetical protein